MVKPYKREPAGLFSFCTFSIEEEFEQDLIYIKEKKYTTVTLKQIEEYVTVNSFPKESRRKRIRADK